MKRTTDFAFRTNTLSGAARFTLSLRANVAKFAVAVCLTKSGLYTGSRDGRALLESDAFDCLTDKAGLRTAGVRHTASQTKTPAAGKVDAGTIFTFIMTLTGFAECFELSAYAGTGVAVIAGATIDVFNAIGQSLNAARHTFSYAIAQALITVGIAAAFGDGVRTGVAAIACAAVGGTAVCGAVARGWIAEIAVAAAVVRRTSATAAACGHEHTQNGERYPHQ